MNIKEANNLQPFEALKLYIEEFRFSALPLVSSTTPVHFKEFTERLPSNTELESFIERYKDADGVALITGFRGLLAFDVDGREAKELFWRKFEQKFGDAPEKLTWVEKRIDPRDGSEHYHIYLIYKDIHTLPANGVEKLFKSDEGEICIIYNQWIRCTPSVHEGTKYQWVHADEITQPMSISKRDLLDFVRCFDPYYEFKHTELGTTKEEAVTIDELDKELSDQQIQDIVNYISTVYPQPGNGRGFLILALSGLLAILGVKQEHANRTVIKIFEEIDPEKTNETKRRFLTFVNSTYKRASDNRVIAYREWLRRLGWTEEEIEEFRNRIVSIVRLRPEEFLQKELPYTLEWRKKTTIDKIDDDGETVVVPRHILQKKIIKPSKKGYFYVYTLVTSFVKPEHAHYYGIEVDGNANGKLVKVSEELVKGEIITSAEVKIRKVIFFGKDVYVDILVDRARFEGGVSTVVNRLVDLGVVRRKYANEFAMYLKWMAQYIDDTDVYEVPGIFTKDGRFIAAIPNNGVELCPVNPFAQEILYKIIYSSRFVDANGYKKFLESIVKYRDFLPNDVYYISMGYMAISPFFDAILPITGVKPILALVGGKGSGKTSLARFITSIAFASEELKQDIFASSFREGVILSSTTFPLLVDDIDKWSSSAIGRLKATVTGRQRMIRGKPSGDLVFYDERASFVLTMNRNVLEGMGDPALLDRALIVNLKRKLSVAEKAKFKQEIEIPLRSGNFSYAHFFVSDLVEYANTIGGAKRIEEMFMEYLTKALESGITDGRDPEKFALIMCGLQLLRGVLVMNGIDFNITEAENAVLNYFKTKDEEMYPDELVNLVALLKQLEIRYDETDGAVPNIHDEYNISRGEEGIYITTLTLTKLQQEKPMVKLPKSLKNVVEFIEDCFEEWRGKKLYTRRKINGKQYRVCLIPYDVMARVLGELDEDSGFEVSELLDESRFKEKLLEEVLESGEEDREEAEERGENKEESSKPKLHKPTGKPRKIWKDEDERADISEYAKEVFANLRKIEFNSEEEFEEFLERELEKLGRFEGGVDNG